MKKRLAILAAGVLILMHPGAAQDTLSVSAEVTLLGRKQSGNLNQVGLSPTALLKVNNSAFDLESRTTYQLLRVNGFTVVNDLWTNTFLRLGSGQRLYPVVVGYYGFADSYDIEQSFIGGAGGGAQLLRSENGASLEVTGFGGWVNVEFTGNPESVNSNNSSMVLGSIIRGNLPLPVVKMKIRWEFHSYHGLRDQQFFGFNNLIQIHYPINKGFQVTANHNTIFNQTVSSGIARTNTLLMFGLTYIKNFNQNQK